MLAGPSGYPSGKSLAKLIETIELLIEELADIGLTLNTPKIKIMTTCQGDDAQLGCTLDAPFHRPVY